jgi:hypothetical protein
MQDKKIKNLIEKYEAGESSLEEEKFLFDNAGDSGGTLVAWSTFVKNNKKTAAANFNETLWESFERQRNKKRRLIIGALSAAASIVLITVSLFISNTQENELSYNEKAALLQESLEMFASVDGAQLEQDIVFENDLIVIYTTSE